MIRYQLDCNNFSFLLKLVDFEFYLFLNKYILKLIFYPTNLIKHSLIYLWKQFIQI